MFIYKITRLHISISCFSIPLLRHFTIFGQENAQNMRRLYTVVSRFDRFITEQIRTEREFFKERNCFQQNAKLENLACHRLSLVILFIQSTKDLWLAFCAVYIVCTRPEGQIMHFFQNTLTK